ncbi:MAG: ERF family protein, partial [Bradyrhizobium sp.]|nr:ERF family protein [Bradyrhizobium sp.]
MRSDETGELAAALAAAQLAIKTPPKDKQVKTPRYTYRYADLPTIIDAIRQPLADAGLAVSQTTVIDGADLSLRTTLLHSSGQWIQGSYPLPDLDSPQAMGSAMTYARRYCLCAILGIAADEDDDGQAAMDEAPQPR